MTEVSRSHTPGASRGGSTFRPSWSKIALAMVIGAGVGYVPTLAQTQPTQIIDQLPAPAKPLLRRFIPNNPASDPTGDRIALVRVIDRDLDPTNPLKAVRTFANADPSDTKRFEDHPGVEIDFSGADDPTAKEITVEASLPKELLRTIDTVEDPNAPLEVLSVSVVVRAGTNTCVWDCYWSNGKKICECVNI